MLVFYHLQTKNRVYMHITRSLLVLIFLTFVFSLKAQEEEEASHSPFFIGINAGAFFPNSNTAHLYRGTSDITPYGILHILSIPQNKQVFDAYFQYPYEVAEFPIETAYKTAAEIGIQLGYEFNSEWSIFLDLVSTRIKYERFFTMAIDKPTNQSVEPNYEQIPVIGEENRFMLNLGTQISLHSEESLNVYFPIFLNVNDTELKSNYLVIDNRNYTIIHNVDNTPNQRPGGIGYGGGSGLGLKFNLSDHLLADCYYYLYYTKTYMTENTQPFGFHHSLGLRVLWR